MLAKNLRTARIQNGALSLATFASKLAPTEGISDQVQVVIPKAGR